MVVSDGDVVIMSAASRLCYHGVPRVFEGLDALSSSASSEANSSSNKQQQTHCKTNSEYVDASSSYWRRGRINVNVRQVYADDREQVFANTDTKPSASDL